MITCELDLKSTPFCDTTILTYEIELSTSGKKIDLDLLDDGDFTITYVTDTIPNSPDGYKIPTYATRNLLIIAISG